MTARIERWSDESRSLTATAIDVRESVRERWLLRMPTLREAERVPQLSAEVDAIERRLRAAGIVR
jgi:hypothetical protein